jgi:uncharacterized protein (TIGR00730 family)
MTDEEEARWKALVRSPQDIETARQVPATPQSLSATYRLAFDDRDFLCREELRPVRLQLELLKTEMAMQEAGIRSTVVMFGSARVPEPGREARSAINKTQARNLRALSRFYDEARQFARLVSAYSLSTGGSELVITTGGGPGLMEAGNRGAADIGARSIGLNIVLPHEQAPNGYISPELCFNFHYFAIRKMHLMLRAKAIVIFPGGYGTMDELFEALTLIQTRRMEPIPFLLFGSKFWKKVVNFAELVRQGTISPGDAKLMSIVDDAQSAWAILRRRYDILAR